MWSEIHGKLMDISNKVPVVSKNNFTSTSTNTNMPWISPSLKRACRNKNLAWSEFDINPTQINLNVAISKQCDFEEVEQKARMKYEKRITNNLKTNPKAFFSYLRNRRQVKTMVTTIKKGRWL